MRGTISAESRKGIPIRKKSTRNPVMITPHMIERMIMTTIITTSYQTTSTAILIRQNCYNNENSQALAAPAVISSKQSADDVHNQTNCNNYPHNNCVYLITNAKLRAALTTIDNRNNN